MVCFALIQLFKMFKIDSCFVGIENQLIQSNKKIINNYNILGKARKINSKI